MFTWKQNLTNWRNPTHKESLAQHLFWKKQPTLILCLVSSRSGGQENTNWSRMLSAGLATFCCFVWFWAALGCLAAFCIALSGFRLVSAGLAAFSVVFFCFWAVLGWPRYVLFGFGAGLC